jgi:hypothetical protein
LPVVIFASRILAVVIFASKIFAVVTASEAIFPAVILASKIFAVVTALAAILSAVIAPVAMDASPKETTHAVPLYVHVVVPTVNSSLRDGEFG